MTTEKRLHLAEKIDTILLFVWGIFFLLFPLFISTLTTDGFLLPKELLLAFVVLLSLLGWGIQMLLNKQVRIRRTPLDVPIILFTFAILLSSLFTLNRADSLIASAGVVFAALSYFVLTNLFLSRRVGLFFLSSLLTGGALATVVTLLARKSIYLFPFATTKTTTFSPLGTPLEYTLLMVMLLPLTFSFVAPALKQRFSARVGLFSVLGLVLIAGIVVVGSSLLSTQKPTLLPFDTGFQTAFAAVSQDSGRVFQTFLFGKGYGNFATAFSRFHNASLNTNEQLWFLSFSNSSSYLLELLATTGFVGILSYLFLAYKALLPVAQKRNNPFYLSLLVTFVLSVVLPFSLLEVCVLFFLLAGLSIFQRDADTADYFDIEFKFVALKRGMLSFTQLSTESSGRVDNHPTPLVACVVLVALVVFLGYYTTIYAYADTLFQQSLALASANNGTGAYRLQAQAITVFPYRSDYYRIFSQTNIALANSLLSLSGSKQPSTAAQQTAFTLIQQAITTARQATTLSPESAAVWQNLSSVYRSLIGVGQNAQDFAIQAAQQATILDSSNPQEFLNLGGLYYQIGQYDNAIRMFQQAIALKANYANAYYNLGHTYEQKNDLTDALTQYQTVAQLVANDKTNEQRINGEIAALQAKIGNPSQAPKPATTPSASEQQPLSLPQQTQLPVQNQQVPLVSPTKNP